MESKLFAAVVVALSVASGLVEAEESSSPTDIERAIERMEHFKLWNECGSVYLVVESLNNDAAEIGLTKERIETAVRSRLRAARIYGGGVFDAVYWDPLIYVNVAVANSAFSVRLDFVKWVTDFVSDEPGSAHTWQTGSIGMHSQDASYILQSVSQHTDKFIDEYLRVNAEAC